ncbi:uncharacterized protein LOC101736890 [Bombyx mori]|uniref:Uncharacterized protein n=1 Tax=Bombyx mori TaxID=7091 RepID=A0A8R1WK94_BOMMO|nr:uncharacterized protein LOC101736890 [Bombyx mori]
MALGGCSSGLLVTALLALVLLPAQYYVPEYYLGVDVPLPIEKVAPPNGFIVWLDKAFVHFPPLDLFFTLSLLILAIVTYLYEWIQRKLMERRIAKLNNYLVASVERLRVWDAQQEQLETTLKMVQNATSEYNLLLYLLLRQHRCLATGNNGPPSNCFFDKTVDDDLSFLRNPIET